MKSRLGISSARQALVLMLALGLAACGGNSPSLSGTAATGAPVVGGTVSVKCAAGASLTTTTASTGAWQVSMAGQTLPCKVRVSGGDLPLGQAFHSLAVDIGTVNITPVTDLVVANMAARAPATWFDDDSAAEFQKITATAVSTALGKVREALPLSTLASLNPMTTSFKAEKGDSLDNVLEAIKNGIPNYSELLSKAQGADFKTYVASYSSAIKTAFDSAAAGSASSSVSAGTSGGTPPAALIGTKTLVFQNAQAGSPYSNGNFIRFAFSSSGMLFYAPLGATISDEVASFTRSASGEYVWYDASKQRAFAVAVNADGSFKEMNVAGSAAGTPWYGQFVEPAAGSLPSDGSGTSKLTLAFTIVGQSSYSYSTVINNVAIPTSKAQFCDDFVNSSASKVSLAKGLATVGTFIVTKCEFSGNVGQVEFNWTSPAYAVPFYQTVTYTYQ